MDGYIEVRGDELVLHNCTMENILTLVMGKVDELVKGAVAEQQRVLESERATSLRRNESSVEWIAKYN